MQSDGGQIPPVRYEKRARETTGGIYNWQEKKALLDELIKEYLQEVLSNEHF